MFNFVNYMRSLVNYAIFGELCDRRRFEVDCAKSHHRVISEGLAMASSWQGLKSTCWTNPNGSQWKHHEHGLDSARHPSCLRRSCWSSKCSFLICYVVSRQFILLWKYVHKLQKYLKSKLTSTWLKAVARASRGLAFRAGSTGRKRRDCSQSICYVTICIFVKVSKMKRS